MTLKHIESSGTLRISVCKIRRFKLLERYDVPHYIQYGWADSVVDPDDASTTSDEGFGAPETDNWIDIKEFYKSPDDVPRFTNAQIVTYFVTRQVCDSRLCGDFKAINRSAMNLFRCGHLQQVELLNTSDTLWLQAYCLPEMKIKLTRLNCLSRTANGRFPPLSADVQLEKDLQPHVNTLVPFAICL